jgi:hypothetical protein
MCAQAAKQLCCTLQGHMRLRVDVYQAKPLLIVVFDCFGNNSPAMTATAGHHHLQLQQQLLQQHEWWI